MKLRTLILGSLTFCLLWFLGWESWAVYVARNKTAAIFAPYTRPGNISLTWNDLSEEQQKILIAVEDPAFFTHKGIDLRTPGSGMTTITQAIAKLLYFEKFTPGFAKIEQSLIAFLVIDPAISKTDQLNTFLAIAYFGKDLTGFDQAARHFFGRPVPALDRPEFIRLVAALIGPKTYPPGTPANEARTVRIAKYLRGECAPKSNRDVYYDACANP